MFNVMDWSNVGTTFVKWGECVTVTGGYLFLILLPGPCRYLERLAGVVPIATSAGLGVSK